MGGYDRGKTGVHAIRLCGCLFRKGVFCVFSARLLAVVETGEMVDMMLFSASQAIFFFSLEDSLTVKTST